MRPFIIVAIAGLLISCSVKKKSSETATIHQEKNILTADSSKTSVRKESNQTDNSSIASTGSSHTDIDEDINMEFAIDPAVKAGNILAQADSATDNRFMNDLFGRLVKSSSAIKLRITRKTSHDTHSSTATQKAVQSGTKIAAEKKTGAVTAINQKLDSQTTRQESKSSSAWSLTGILLIVGAVAAVYLIQRFSLITWFIKLFKK